MSLSRNLLSTAAIGLVLAACSTVPGSGPRTADIEKVSPNYTLVDLNPTTTRAVNSFVAEHHVERPIELPPAIKAKFLPDSEYARAKSVDWAKMESLQSGFTERYLALAH